MEGFSDDEVIVVADDNFSSQTTTGTGETLNSQGSAKGILGFACSSQDSAKNTKIDAGEIEIINLAQSQESPFLIPSRQVSTPYWKDQPRFKRKCDNSSTPTSVQKKCKIEPDAGQPHSSNGTEELSSVHNSLEEHTYARKVFCESVGVQPKNVSYGSTFDEEENLQKIEVELPARFTIVYSHNKKQVLSVSMSQIYNSDSFHQSSLSSGRLADDSDSSHHDSGSTLAKARLLNVTNSSSTSSSTTASSVSSVNKKTGGPDPVLNQNVPSSGQTLKSLSKPKTCVCSCFCKTFFDQRSVVTPNSSVNTLSGQLFPSVATKSEPIVTSTSNSDENPLPVESKPVKKNLRSPVKAGKRSLKGKTPKVGAVSGRRKSQSSRSKVKEQQPVRKQSQVKPSLSGDEVSTSDPTGLHQCPHHCKFGKDLLVFAKWPADKIYYPAIVRNCFYTDWEYSDNLTVVFFDGAKLNLSSVNIFPASLIVRNNSITYKNDNDEYLDGIVTNVERRHPVGPSKNDTCIYFTVKCDEDEDENYGQELEVPFNLTALNDICYKQLKKEIGESILTPHKFSRKTYDICDDNLLEGKRKRRGIEKVPSREFSVSAVSSSSNKRSRITKRSESEFLQIDEDSSPAEEDTNAKQDNPSSYSETRPLRSKKPTKAFSLPTGLKTRTSRKTPKTEVKASSTRIRKSRVDLKEIAGTSSDKKPKTAKGLVFRNDVVSEEEHSETEDDDDTFLQNVDITTIGGGDLEYECFSYTRTSRKSANDSILKSCSPKSRKVSKDDENLSSSCGPIPTSPLFSGYSFVITHGGPNSYYRNKDLWKDQKESELSTDYEEAFSTPYTFDQERLKNQIIGGKGRVYNHLLLVPQDCLEKTLVISDFICQTANYLLAATLNVPVYSHSLIVNSCIKNASIEKMLKSEMPLPFGITSDRTWHSYSKKRRIEPLKDYLIILASTETNHRLRIWTKIVRLAGGKISYFTPERNLLGGRLSYASLIIVDDYCPPELTDSAQENSVPLVNTRYLVDTVIRGHKQLMLDPTLNRYKADLNLSSQQSLDNSQHQ